jgi:transcriptional regulator with XRE-family HTH domain
MFITVSPRDPANPGLAAAIRRLRGRQGLNQEDVAYKARITTGTLSRIENGLNNPAWTTVERIAEALGVGLVELVDEVERGAGD